MNEVDKRLTQLLPIIEKKLINNDLKCEEKPNTIKKIKL